MNHNGIGPRITTSFRNELTFHVHRLRFSTTRLVANHDKGAELDVPRHTGPQLSDLFASHDAFNTMSNRSGIFILQPRFTLVFLQRRDEDPCHIPIWPAPSFQFLTPAHFTAEYDLCLPSSTFMFGQNAAILHPPFSDLPSPISAMPWDLEVFNSHPRQDYEYLQAPGQIHKPGPRHQTFASSRLNTIS